MKPARKRHRRHIVAALTLAIFASLLSPPLAASAQQDDSDRIFGDIEDALKPYKYTARQLDCGASTAGRSINVKTWVHFRRYQQVNTGLFEPWIQWRKADVKIYGQGNFLYWDHQVTVRVGAGSKERHLTTRIVRERWEKLVARFGWGPFRGFRSFLIDSNPYIEISYEVYSPYGTFRNTCRRYIDGNFRLVKSPPPKCFFISCN
ncbi:MAG: hypothetical protein AAGD35_10845 [Actinomycetota bacterium]